VVQTEYDATGQPTTLSNTAGYFYVEAAHYDLFGRVKVLGKGNGFDDRAFYYGAPNSHRLSKIEYKKESAVVHAQTYQGYTARGQVGTIVDWSSAPAAQVRQGGDV
jgi:hypothetical protein